MARTKTVFDLIAQKNRLFARMLDMRSSERQKRRILKVLFPN